jgi:hypothetical protein
MTLSAAKVKAAKWTITAHNVEGLQSLRAIIGPIGYETKKKHPNLSAINAVDGSNCLTVQEQDLICVVDLITMTTYFIVTAPLMTKELTLAKSLLGHPTISSVYLMTRLADN